jgi:tRNA-(ms[2]io[6]A)-hydroxylase
MLCLSVPSTPEWALSAAEDMNSVLVDHAHCEMKAAVNALSLAAHPPKTVDAHAVVRTLTDIAREEIEHFQDVIAILEQRGVALGPPRTDPYAVALRRASQELGPTSLPPLVDRLLVAALIEARSCERFKLLTAVLADGPDDILRAFYERLFVAEARHYRTFVDLAITAANRNEDGVHARLTKLAALEGAIVSNLPDRPSRATVHG